jgi:hypothetical protein
MNPGNNNPTNREKNPGTGSQGRKCSGRDPGRRKILPATNGHFGVQQDEPCGPLDFFRDNLQVIRRNSGAQHYDHGRKQEFFRLDLPAPGPEPGEAG